MNKGAIGDIDTTAICIVNVQCRPILAAGAVDIAKPTVRKRSRRVGDIYCSGVADLRVLQLKEPCSGTVAGLNCNEGAIACAAVAN